MAKPGAFNYQDVLRILEEDQAVLDEILPELDKRRIAEGQHFQVLVAKRLQQALDHADEGRGSPICGPDIEATSPEELHYRERLAREVIGSAELEFRKLDDATKADIYAIARGEKTADEIVARILVAVAAHQKDAT